MLPIAETFHSIQGEGTYVGTPMHFIRLAGCPVGAAATQEASSAIGSAFGLIPILSNGVRGSHCKTYDGRRFTCDTDFSVHSYQSVQDLINATWERHICLTGGEPLIHQRNLVALGFFAEAWQRKIQIHVETSGTVPLVDTFMFDKRLWVTVAPKWGCSEEMIKRADEVKLLVDENFKDNNLPAGVIDHPNVFLSPINFEKDVDLGNVHLALDLLRHYPHWRLSAQWHKFLGLR